MAEDTRRRTGCHQCKEKHIQCTEEHPRCRRCETLNLQCTRGLRLTFKEDAVQRGLSFGREGLWSKRPRSKASPKAPFRGLSLRAYKDNWIFINATADDTPISTPSTPSSGDHGITPSLLRYSYHPLHSFSETDAYLLDYFIHGISPSCSLSTSYNPYISLIIPLCFTSNTLRNALLAVAANQLCLLGHTNFRQKACFYKHKAFQGLRQRISDNAYDEGTAASVLMLCFQDISDGCSPSWITHLRGGLQLLHNGYTQRTPVLWSFFRMYFVAHEIMSRTACDEWDGESSQLWADDDDLEIDILMGCSRGLMTLIHRISVLASRTAKILDHRPLDTSETRDYTASAVEIYDALFFLRQELPAYAINQTDLVQIADIKRLAGLLYLHERLGSLKEIQDLLPSPSPFHKRRQSPIPSKAHLITSIINSISTLPPKSTNSATLLWPLFILGTASPEDESQRRFVLDRLMDIQRARNLGSVRRTIDAVKDAFGRMDLGTRVKKGGLWGCERGRFISLA